MRHPYFKGIEWENLRNQEAPIIPQKKDAMDTSNFTRINGLSEKDKVSPFGGFGFSRQASQICAEQTEAFQEFDMVRYDLLDTENQKNADKAVRRHAEEIKNQDNGKGTLSNDEDDMSPPSYSLFDVPAGFDDVTRNYKRGGGGSSSNSPNTSRKTSDVYCEEVEKPIEVTTHR